MNVYLVFRIVLGIIASFLILFFLVNYAGIYTEMQEDTQCMMIINNFKKAAEDVYLSGNGIVFEDFKKLDCGVIFDGKVNPAMIRSVSGQQMDRMPMIFLPGEKLIIEKKSLDYGWWKFDFVEALPEMTIIFNIMEVNDDTRGLANSIIDMLPDTTGRTPKIRYGFCEGNSIIKPCDNGLSFCEGYRFFSEVDDLVMPMAECDTVSMDQTLVKISQTCSGNNEKGVCIAPPDPSGVGRAYINGTTEAYMYKIYFSGTHSNNPLDLVALIVGGDRKNIYGSVAGSLYVHENVKMRQELELMTDIMKHRSSLISTNLPIQPSQYDENEQCKAMHDGFINNMEDINSIASDEEYYTDPISVAMLMDLLINAESTYQNIIDIGCDYVVE